MTQEAIMDSTCDGKVAAQRRHNGRLVETISIIYDYLGSLSIIDNIFTNELQRITSSGLIINDLSDHLPIFQICDYTDDVHSNRNQYKTKETRLINDQTLQNFSQMPCLQLVGMTL